jgi:hypothetical protein
MHIAICFWGLLRSLPFTVKSIEKYILQPLRQYDYTYDIFIHTYSLQGTYSSSRNNEVGITINASHYHLLKPQYIYIEDQDEFDANINYWLYSLKGDPWNNDFSSFKNHIRALNSLYHVTMAVESVMKGTVHHHHHRSSSSSSATSSLPSVLYDGILFIRPDVEFLHSLPIELLPINDKKFYEIISSKQQQQNNNKLSKKEEDILQILPTEGTPSLLREQDFHHLKEKSTFQKQGVTSSTTNQKEKKKNTNFEKEFKEALYLPDFHRSCQGNELNDRMALGTITSGLLYGKKFTYAYDYSTMFPLHAEKFTNDYLKDHVFLTPIEIPFRFRRIRSDGRIHIRDYEAILPDEQQELIKKGIYFVGKGRRTPSYLRAIYNTMEALTLYQRYIWNHDDHGNIFCHPQPFISFSQFTNYQNHFQSFYQFYQEYLFYHYQLPSSSSSSSASSSSSLSSATTTSSTTATTTEKDSNSLFSSSPSPSISTTTTTSGSFSSLPLHDYYHHLRKYKRYSSNKSRKMHCSYQRIYRSVDKNNHMSLLHKIPSVVLKNYLLSSFNVTNTHQFITSYVIPVNCSVHLQHDEEQSSSSSANNTLSSSATSVTDSSSSSSHHIPFLPVKVPPRLRKRKPNFGDNEDHVIQQQQDHRLGKDRWSENGLKNPHSVGNHQHYEHRNESTGSESTTVNSLSTSAISVVNETSLAVS